MARNILLAELTGGARALPALERRGQRGVDPRGEEARRADFRRSVPASFHADGRGHRREREFLARGWKGRVRLQRHGATLPAWPNYDTNFKMNPPLRSARDREAILEGLADGTIEIICSDHAPHCDYEKEVEFDYAPFGITGLETELALSLMQLYHTRKMSLPDVMARSSRLARRACCSWRRAL